MFMSLKFFSTYNNKESLQRSKASTNGIANPSYSDRRNVHKKDYNNFTGSIRKLKRLGAPSTMTLAFLYQRLLTHVYQKDSVHRYEHFALFLENRYLINQNKVHMYFVQHRWVNIKTTWHGEKILHYGKYLVDRIARNCLHLGDIWSKNEKLHTHKDPSCCDITYSTGLEFLTNVP